MTKIRTKTHEYTIDPGRSRAGIEVWYQPLNPKTGEPWQALRRVEIGATITPPGWHRPIAYPTIEAAEAAVAAQTAAFIRRGRT